MPRRKTKANPDRLAAIGEVAGEFKGWAPGREVLTPVHAVPTIFPQFDVATRVGGLPLQRIVTVHGPSNHGKTVFCHGLGLSFLMRGNFYAFIDAEFTTPEDWVRKLMHEYADHPGFVAKRPNDYDEVRADVRSMLDRISDARDAGRLPEDTAALIVVDSIRKLVPKGLADKVSKGDEKAGHDGAGGRGGQIKAGVNAAWMDELVPMLNRANATMVLIARESENPDKVGKYDPDYKVTGGKAIIYDSSLVVRIERASWVRKGKDPGQVVGERHRATITKTKIAGKDDRVVRSYFHTSNGVLVPEGFDHARDLVELAKESGRFKLRGSWLTDAETGESWNGVHEAVKAISEWQPEQLAGLRNEVVAGASPVEVEEHESDEAGA